MLQLADIIPNCDVLEVGSGSGWNACLAAYLAYPCKTISLERIPELGFAAKFSLEIIKNYLKKKNIQEMRRLNQLRFDVGDFFTLPKEKHQFDRITITAGIEPEQENILNDRAADLLKPDGLLICPYTRGPLMILSKTKNAISVARSSDSFVFVPLLENNH